MMQLKFSNKPLKHSLLQMALTGDLFIDNFRSIHNRTAHCRCHD